MNEDTNTPEHSERARYVTEQVALWITNDGDFYHAARLKFGAGGTERMASFLTAVLRRTDHVGTAPWHVAQELAPDDYARIHWADVAAELMAD